MNCEGSGLPIRRSGVAGNTVGRQVQRYVIGVAGLVEISGMACRTLCGRSGVACGMAFNTLCGQVRARQREIGGIVVERSRRPRGF